jgi:hypothetical protein
MDGYIAKPASLKELEALLRKVAGPASGPAFGPGPIPR